MSAWPLGTDAAWKRGGGDPRWERETQSQWGMGEDAFSQSASHQGQLIPSPARSGYISLPPWSVHQKPAVDTREGGPLKEREGRGQTAGTGQGK